MGTIVYYRLLETFKFGGDRNYVKLMERWKLSISVEKRVKLPNQVWMYFVEIKKCNNRTSYFIENFYTTAGGQDYGIMTLNFCLMKNCSNCPTFSSVPSSRGEKYLTVAWFIRTALSSHLHYKIMQWSSCNVWPCAALCLVKLTYFSVNLF